MNRIITKTDEQKKQRKNQLIIGIILILVMIVSTFGIVVNSFGDKKNSNKINYNGYEFVNQNGVWVLNAQNISFIFKYNPLELENFSINSTQVNKLDSYSGKPLYIYSEDSLATSEIYRNIQPFALRIQSACLDEKNCPEDLPIKTCNDNFIIIKTSNTSQITQQDNCVFIEGNGEDLIKTSDLFIYKIFNIKS